MYIDPGAGSIIIQILIGIAIAIPALMGIYWRRTRSVFSSIFRKKNSK